VSGHSKWAQIKRKKAVTDARRGQLFTKLLREVAVAARLGGPEAAGNARLRAAVAEAKAQSVPKENSERAVAKGSVESGEATFEEAVLEGYAAGGVAVLVETLTDDRNRTVADVRHAFSKHGGGLGENGCVAWMFDQRGSISVPLSAMSEDAVLDLVLELGAEDARIEDEAYAIETAPAELLRIRDEMEARELPVVSAALVMVPRNLVEPSPDAVPAVAQLIEALEDLDDVQQVWANIDPDVVDAHEAR